MIRTIGRWSTPSRLAVALSAACLMAGPIGCGGGGGGGSGSIAGLAISTQALPDGTVGAAYQASLDATGGRDPIGWSVASGQQLPPGIGLAGTQGRQASLGGTPAAAGAYSFEIEARDSAGKMARQGYTLGVYDALAIQTATLTDGEVDEPYLETIQAAGGKAPFAWSLAAGALPPGFTLGPSATSSIDLQGTATATGSHTFTILVQDAAGRSAQAAYTVRFDDIERYVYAGKLDMNSNEQVYMTEIVNGAPAAPRRLLDNVWTGSFSGMVPIATSPDGKFVAAIMDRDVNNAMDLFLVDLRGPSAGRIRKVNGGALGGNGGQWVSRMFWSPDSRWIAFVGDVATAGVQDIFVADVTVAAAIAPVNITSYISGQSVSLWDTAFTSDSRHLVFIGDVDPNPQQNPSGWIRELFFADLAAATPAPVQLSITLSDRATMDVETFSVADSGNGIAYRGDVLTDGIQDVYHVALSQGQAGPNVRATDAATAHASVVGPWISPDGRRVLFTSGVSQNQQIPDPTFNLPFIPGQLAYVVDRQAAAPAPVRLTAANDGHVQQPVWSPDGARVLVYRQSYDANNVLLGSELLLIDAATRASWRINAATWDGVSVDTAYLSGPWGPMGLDQYAYGFSPNSRAIYYKQQTAMGFSFFGTTYKYDLFVADVGGAGPAAAVQASPNVAITSGGVRDDVRFSADSSRIVLTYRNTVAGGLIEIYVHDLVSHATTIVGSSTTGRLNNNTPGPKWTPGDEGLVLSGPLEAANPAWNGVYFLDLVGGRLTLSPPGVSNGDVSEFFAHD